MAANDHGTPERPEQPAEIETIAPEPQSGGQQSSGGVFGIPTRLLLIGGGGGGAVLAIVIVVVLLFVTGVIGGGNPQPSSVLDLVPDDAELVTRLDLARILRNDLLADEFFDDADWEWLEDDLDMDREDLSELLVVVRDGAEIVVMAGDFDLDAIREELEDDDNEENSYRGYEVWEDPDGSAGALLEGYIVFSETHRPVENVLKNLYNGEGSLEKADEDNEMKQILDKVGSGFVVFGVTGDVCWVERCEGYGWAMTEVDESDEEATVEIALLFRNERGAERAADDYDEVADFLEQEGFDIEDTEADGEFVVGEAIQDLAEEESRNDTRPAAPAATAAPAAPAVMSRGDWIDDCYAESSYLERGDCGCVHDYLRDEGHYPIPHWDDRWEDGRGVGAEAVNWCY